MVWRIDASNGEHVSAGDPVLEVVDCRASRLLVAIPQSRVPDVLIGGTARVRLTGEQTVRNAQVISALGDPAQGDNRKLAATPLKKSDERMATVDLLLEGSRDASFCAVGRTATVELPAIHSTQVVRWARQYF